MHSAILHIKTDDYIREYYFVTRCKYMFIIKNIYTPKYLLNIGKVIIAIDRIKYITESQIPSDHILHHKHQKCAHYDKDSQLEKLLVYTIM